MHASRRPRVKLAGQRTTSNTLEAHKNSRNDIRMRGEQHSMTETDPTHQPAHSPPPQPHHCSHTPRTAPAPNHSAGAGSSYCLLHCPLLPRYRLCYCRSSVRRCLVVAWRYCLLTVVAQGPVGAPCCLALPGLNAGTLGSVLAWARARLARLQPRRGGRTHEIQRIRNSGLHSDTRRTRAHAAPHAMF